jgi:hypothetical protein
MSRLLALDLVDSLTVGKVSGDAVGMASVVGSTVRHAKSSNVTFGGTVIENIIESCLRASMRNCWVIELSSATLQ